MKARERNAQKNQLLNDGDILILKRIIDKNPTSYLDEVAFQFGLAPLCIAAQFGDA